MTLSAWIDELRSLWYDKRHRVHTCGSVRLEAVTIDSNNARLATGYQATPASSIRFLIRSLNVDYPRTTFIDIGSGKGRCLLVAAEYPFKSVLGVEFARELHEIAQENIHKYRGKRACQEVRSLLVDAARFQFPTHPLLIHFFNPFSPAVMKTVLDNIARCPGGALLAFQSNLYPKDCVQAAAGIAPLKQIPYFDIYRTAIVSL
jgi:SAM-dependent methyltransferase